MSQSLVLSEWDRRSIVVGDPTRADLDLVSRLERETIRKLDLRWLRGGRLEVRTTSWVGVVRLSCVAIQVRPKYAGNELGVLQMLRYAGGYQSMRRLSAQRSLAHGGSDLLDLICLLLAEEAALLLRDGALHDYSEEEDSLTTLRGSLRLREQVTRRFGQLDRLECRFDEFHADVIENQLLRRGLECAAAVCGDPAVRRQVRRLEQQLGELCSNGQPDPSYYRSRIGYGRRNERYRAAHELSYLLMENVGVDDLFARGATDSFAFLLDMNRVFESFMSALIDEAFTDTAWSVSTQSSQRSVVKNRVTGKRYTTIVPDIVLSNGSESVPFDCKYKLYGRSGKKISAADIYQSFLYAYALSGEDELARAGLIFPATETGATTRLGISRVNGPMTSSLTGISIDLLGVLDVLDDAVAKSNMLTEVKRAMSEVLHLVAHNEGGPHGSYVPVPVP